MHKTLVFVTNQFSCDRIIRSARVIANQTKTELLVLSFLDSQYDLNPQAIEYLFSLAKDQQGTMSFLFSQNRLNDMKLAIEDEECLNIVTGMPSNAQSVLYDIWNTYGDKNFYTVDEQGAIIQVADRFEYQSARSPK